MNPVIKIDSAFFYAFQWSYSPYKFCDENVSVKHSNNGSHILFNISSLLMENAFNELFMVTLTK